jgi:Protein of unknown function (DUF2846)
MKFSGLIAITVVLGLTGCAASGPKLAEMQSSMPTLKADQGRVYFYRASGLVGAGLQPSVMLDGSAVGDSKPGGFFYVDTNAGSHEAVTSTEVSNKVTFALDKGEVKYVRTKATMGVLVYRIVPELVGQDEAKKEMAELSYTGATKAK